MAKTLQEYAEWLETRDDLIWPKPPESQQVNATPSIHPLPGIRAVTWNVYGTLLRISDGQLMLIHPQPLRMQVALEKTIQEFRMWHSMSRKPGAPWEYMLQQYRRLVEDLQMAGTGRKGDFPQVNAAHVWCKLLERLRQNEYAYDEEFYGDLDELSEKVAYFFHACLQGIAASPEALPSLAAVARSGITQGLLCDAQPFTVIQMLRAFQPHGTLPPLGDLFQTNCVTLSYQEGVRQPSKALYAAGLQKLHDLGIDPPNVLHIGSRLKNDLAAAKQFGMKTALFAGDKSSVQATAADVKDPNLKPDRLMTKLDQICQILDLKD